MEFQSGDIIAIRGSGWLPDNICKATHSEVSHVGLVIGTSPTIVIEALWRVKTNPIAVTINNAEKVWCIRYPNLTDKNRVDLVQAALKFSADDYGGFDLVLQLADAAFKTKWFTENIGKTFLNHFPICSFLVAAAYRQIGITFSSTDWSVTPSDIMNFALLNKFLVQRSYINELDRMDKMVLQH